MCLIFALNLLFLTTVYYHYKTLEEYQGQFQPKIINATDILLQKFVKPHFNYTFKNPRAAFHILSIFDSYEVTEAGSETWNEPEMGLIRD
jgi:hypothetical protein